MKPKAELIRLVKVDNKIIVDKTQKIQARGFYVSKDLSVIEKLKKSKALNRAFKTEVPEALFEEVEKLCKQTS
jgi:hypothetical protein